MYSNSDVAGLGAFAVARHCSHRTCDAAMLKSWYLESINLSLLSRLMVTLKPACCRISTPSSCKACKVAQSSEKWDELGGHTDITDFIWDVGVADKSVAPKACAALLQFKPVGLRQELHLSFHVPKTPLTNASWSASFCCKPSKPGLQAFIMMIFCQLCDQIREKAKAAEDLQTRSTGRSKVVATEMR